MSATLFHPWGVRSRDFGALCGELAGARLEPGEGVQVSRMGGGQTVALLPRPEWPHPWRISPVWMGREFGWAAAVRPGFVNGETPTATVPEKYLAAAGMRGGELGVRASSDDARTLAALDLAALQRATEAAEGKTAKVALTDRPPMPMRWRKIGWDGGQEPVPGIFRARGVAAAPKTGLDAETGSLKINRDRLVPPKRLRLLRACDIALYKDRAATTSEWTFGTGIEGTVAKWQIGLRAPSNLRAKPYLRSLPLYEPPKPPTALDRLMGVWEDVTYDSLLVGTVYMLSPSWAQPGSEPDKSWTPFVRHELFWNLNHARRNEVPRNLDSRVFIWAGLATPLANAMLAMINDQQDQMLNWLNNNLQEGSFWSA